MKLVLLALFYKWEEKKAESKISVDGHTAIVKVGIWTNAYWI